MFRFQVRMHPELDILVSSIGEVYLPKSGSHLAHWTFGHIKDKDQYLYVKIDGKRYAVGELVADTFNLNPDNKETIEHKNRNRQDNTVYNIKGATRKEQSMNRGVCIQCKKKYGLHKSEDPNGYAREWRKEHLERSRKIARDCWRRKHWENYEG